ncbi:VOC family protein [Leptospira ognonensis]|uniref:VOC family protein n=1 Tax=Leptospira ognonensis TaxID=2484945 RepID=A0A4R9KDE9_9LEPT|nr:VOC family protein [Leptospira ognonensis]TGL63965.1 VOC family protein [Leptospira ognonensis]
MSKITPFLMFNDQLESAIKFYTSLFPDSEIKNIAKTGNEGPITSAEFTIGGQLFMAYNGGPYFQFSNGFSLFVHCETQDEIDKYWNQFISAGAKPLQCGWITDQFGITWQIVPTRFMELINDNDPKKVQAVMDAMMQMIKLEIHLLEKAYHEA